MKGDHERGVNDVLPFDRAEGYSKFGDGVLALHRQKPLGALASSRG